MFSEGMWIAAVGVALGVDLYVAFRRPVRIRYISKPLIVALLVVCAAMVSTPVSGFYRVAVILGLLCSLAGDILLIRKEARFQAGVAAFFLAHVLYSAAFISRGAVPATPWAIVLLAAYIGILLRGLLPYSKGMRLSVIAYALVIGTMALLALEMWIAVPATHTAYALGGAVCFVISDTILAVDHFVVSIRGATAYVMATYAAAQLLIAFSVVGV